MNDENLARNRKALAEKILRGEEVGATNLGTVVDSESPLSKVKIPTEPNYYADAEKKRKELSDKLRKTLDESTSHNQGSFAVREGGNASVDKKTKLLETVSHLKDEKNLNRDGKLQVPGGILSYWNIANERHYHEFLCVPKKVREQIGYEMLEAIVFDNEIKTNFATIYDMEMAERLSCNKDNLVQSEKNETNEYSDIVDNLFRLIRYWKKMANHLKAET